MNKLITILLATYNGGKYLDHQIKSIIHQTYTNWRLIIRDDNSKDNTVHIIEKYKSLFPDKISVLQNNGENKGSLYNFSTLLSAVTDAEYIMFCDQDDEWKKNKIEITFSKMQELEREHGVNCPIFVFTDFQYVDENMNTIESKKNFEINRIKNFGFAQLLAQNPVYGCTTMLNRALADKVGTIPAEADFHDHWIALIASAFGKLFYLKEKTVLYRQHGKNVSGNWDNDSLKKRIKRIVVNKKNFAEAQAKYKMLLTFKKKYEGSLNEISKKVLSDFLCFYTKKNMLCMLRTIRNGVRSQTLAQSLLLYTTLFLASYKLPKPNLKNIKADIVSK